METNSNLSAVEGLKLTVVAYMERTRGFIFNVQFKTEHHSKDRLDHFLGEHPYSVTIIIKQLSNQIPNSL